MNKPDFLIIGAMKSGTTSLFAWLNDQPEFALPTTKETGFFTDDRVWARGIAWYRMRFSDAGISGEASISYTLPPTSELAAQRIRHHLPDVKLVFVARHPLERTRSHYRHELQRGREKRSFTEAVADADSPYVRASMYYSCLKPYFDRFDTNQICIIRTEDLSGPYESGWADVLAFLDVPPRPKPMYRRNESRSKPAFTRPLLKAWEMGLTERTKWVPTPVRSVARRLLTRTGGAYGAAMLESEQGSVPSIVEQMIWDDVSRLEHILDRGPLWSRTDRG